MYFRTIIIAALIVGVIAGVVSGTYRIFQVDPVILAAEQYELPAETHIHDDGTAHQHEHEAWSPEDGQERSLFSIFTNALANIGFAALLLSVMSLKQGVDIKKGILWGLAGFACFFMFPTLLGLLPEIPGTEAAELSHRQAWWLLSVVCTAAGLACLAFAKPAWKVFGLVLLVFPFIIGVPKPEVEGFANADALVELTALSHDFIWKTSLFNLINWLLLGIGCGFAVSKFIYKLDSKHSKV